MAQIILALDYEQLDEALKTVRLLKDEISFFKVGLQLFTMYGPDAVKAVMSEGVEVFLDLKLHDIPNTCALAVKSAEKLGCYSLTIHTKAGIEALRAAAEIRTVQQPRLWGVTALSSITGEDSISGAQLALEAGLDGVIVSGDDTAKVKNRFPSLTIVTPGIRPSSYAKKDDQKKIMTPAMAVSSGADFLVIGRPIREADDPLAVTRAIKEEIKAHD